MGRTRRFSVSLDGDPRVPAFTRNMLPMLLLASLFFASSAAVISCPSDGGSNCSPINFQAAFNMTRQSFATCEAGSPPSQTPPMPVETETASAAATASVADQPTKLLEDGPPSPATEPIDTRPPPPAAAAAASTETTTTAVPADPQPQIATFDEWTKAKLQQPSVVAVPLPLVPGSVPPGSNHPVPVGGSGATVSAQSDSASRVVAPAEAAAQAATTTRNYASRECGAKVIYSNPEAENTKAVLNDKEKDDYMRNPCDKAQHKHIVIELCETIQPRSIEIANFELFSSGPASVRFSAAERFPSQQWSVLGEWSLADSRTVQTLPVPADKLTYAKFIKLELLAHHGAEHYCTLSTVRVLGVSMVDEYEAEATVAARLSVPHAVPSSAPDVQVVPTSPSPANEDLPVKKEEPVPVAEAASPTIPTTPTEATPIVAATTEVPPIAVVEAPPTAAAAATAADAGGKSDGGLVQDVMSGTLLKKIIAVVGGGRGDKKKEESEQSQSLFRGPRESAYAVCGRTPIGVVGGGVAGGRRPLMGCVRHHFFCPPPALSSLLVHNMTTTSSSMHETAAARRAHARRLLVATTQRRQEEEEEHAAPRPHTMQPPTQIDAPPPHRKATTVAPVVQQLQQQQSQQQQQPAAAAAALPLKDEESPPVDAKRQSPTTAPPIVQQQQQQAASPPVGIFEGLPAGTSSHKESVFMKLNKRIAALELNMSLSTEYLSELSRQYIAHTDEQKRAMERTRIAAERAAVDVARTVNETVRDELFNLRKEVDALSVWLTTLRQQAGGVTVARRIAGDHVVPSHYETSATPQSSSSSPASVGHRRQSSIEMEAEEDYVTYEEAYEQRLPSICPYSGQRRSREGRAHGPQPRPVSEEGPSSDEEKEEEEQEEEHADAFDLRHFRHHSDGIWTTEQVLYAVLGAQALTVILVLLMQACYSRVFGRRRLVQPMQLQQQQPIFDATELDRLIGVALERRGVGAPPPVDPEAVAVDASSSSRSTASSMTSSSTALQPQQEQQQQQQSNKKKRRRQRRSTVEQQQQPQQNQSTTSTHHQHECRQCGGRPGASLDWDSAMDSSLPSPSQTGSEEEFEVPSTSVSAVPT